MLSQMAMLALAEHGPEMIGGHGSLLATGVKLGTAVAAPLVLKMARSAGLHHVDDIVREAVLNPDISRALLSQPAKNEVQVVRMKDFLGKLKDRLVARAGALAVSGVANRPAG